MIICFILNLKDEGIKKFTRLSVYLFCGICGTQLFIVAPTQKECFTTESQPA
jgi:hypothetical protein